MWQNFFLFLNPQNVENCALLSNIYAIVGRGGDVAKVRKMMKDARYVPTMNFLLQDVEVEEEDKGRVLYGHSEKLANIFGLINTCPKTHIRVINNLRMCGDYNIATKFICRFCKARNFC